MHHNWPIQLIISNEESKWNLTLISAQRHQDVWCHLKYQDTQKQIYVKKAAEIFNSYQCLNY